jgi:N-acetylglutamate synthase-like GNAT family acetyltransferase
MHITHFTIDDIKALPALQPPDWQDITPHFRYYLQSASAFPLKVTRDAQVLGVGTVLAHEDTAWLAHIIVHPEFRNQDIGKMLTQALLDSIDKKIFKTVYLMATPLGEPVYRKLGFIEETQQLFMKDGGSFDTYKPASLIMPLDHRYLDALLKMDRRISGENRTSRIMEGLQDTMLYIVHDEVMGYYMPHLGEGLVIANDVEAGIQLMQCRLKTHPVAILPVDNKVAVDFLYSHGFKVFRKATRMRLGEYREWQAEYIFNRISGQIG